MPTRRSMPPPRAQAALERRDRTAQDPVSRRHWPMGWLLAHGHPSAPGAAVTGGTATWGRAVAQRANPHSPAGLGDRRRGHPGAAGR